MVTDPALLFPGKVTDVWLEIGFGGGEHLLAQALANPTIGFIGCEPFINGMAKLLSEIETRGITNIRLYDNDAMDLLGVFAGGVNTAALRINPLGISHARHAVEHAARRERHHDAHRLGGIGLRMG